MKYKRGILTLSLVCLLCLSACANQPQTIIDGQRQITSVSRGSDLGIFHSIYLHDIQRAGSSKSIAIQVKLIPSDAPGVELTTHDDLLRTLRCEVTNGCLEFQATANAYYRFDKLSLDIYYPKGQLTEVRSNGSYTISSGETVVAQNLTIVKQGEGEMALDVRANKLDLTASDAASVRLSGSTEELAIRTAGTANVNAFSLKAERASVSIRGSGECQIGPSTKLNVQLVGSGTVEYAGDPEIYKVLFGPGSVRQSSQR